MHIQRNLVSHVAVSWHPHSKPRNLWLWNEDADLQLYTSILKHSLKLSTTDAKLMQNRDKKSTPFTCNRTPTCGGMLNSLSDVIKERVNSHSWFSPDTREHSHIQSP